MKILKVESGYAKFLINDKEIKPDELSRKDLLDLLNSIYDLPNQSLLSMPHDSEMNLIRNPIEKEIVNQIIQKIEDFSENVVNIQNEINLSFPPIN